MVIIGNKKEQNMKRGNANPCVGAFKGSFDAQREDGKPWSGGKSLTVVSATLEVILKPDGTRIELTPKQTDTIAALFNPTVPNQMAVVKTVIADAGGILDPDTEALVKTMLNPAGVQKQIENAAKPGKVRLADMIG